MNLLVEFEHLAGKTIASSAISERCSRRWGRRILVIKSTEDDVLVLPVNEEKPWRDIDDEFLLSLDLITEEEYERRYKAETEQRELKQLEYLLAKYSERVRGTP